MTRGMIVRSGSAALACLVIFAGPSPAEQANAVSEDIIVIGQRLSEVRVNTHVEERRLRRCTITRSSGDEEADAAVCGIVRVCVNMGRWQPDTIKACTDRRIEALVTTMEAGDGEQVKLPADIVFAMAMNGRGRSDR